MHWPEILAAASWSSLVTYWLFARRFVKEAVTQEALRQQVEYSIPACVGTILVVWGTRGAPHPSALDGLYISASIWGRSAGAVTTIAGSAFAIWARATLGRNWSARVLIKEDHRLIEHGPYRFVRHPIYAGILLMMMGTIAVIGTAASLPGLLLIFAAVLIKTRREEKILQCHFGDSYQRYSRKAKKLLPLIW